MHKLVSALLIFCCLGSCTLVLNRLGTGLVSEAPQVLVTGLPPGYDPARPRPSYTGPHPSQLAFDLRQFEFPVALGDVGPIDYSLGPLQYPFACETLASDLGQPLIDNQLGAGTPVFAETLNGELTDQVLGYSQDCGSPSRVDYFYKPIDGHRLLPLPDSAFLPANMAFVELEGRRIPFVVALERGTINRFIYGIAMLADPQERRGRPNGRHWNQRLVYYFRGGVGIGKRQGRLRVGSMLNRRLEQLGQGYAVVFSTGNQTSNHYNIWLAGHTAAMVKAQFTALYGEPAYSIGIGESGGAVQQYLIAQNQPGILDALIPVYSYPDMITQTIWALDCELLEYYFDVTDADNPRWRQQENRIPIAGLAARSDIENPMKRFDDVAQRLRWRRPRLAEGATECALSWRGLTPLTNNPHYYHRANRYSPEVAAVAQFTHWHDLMQFYGVGPDGFANSTYDNTGVQYGLQALLTGSISAVDFLHINANIGSWKPAREMRQERLWLLSGDEDLTRLSLWSDHNMRKTPGGPTPRSVFARQQLDAIRVAPRNQGHAGAMAAAYYSGHVFLGKLDIPVVDLRHYLDPMLDMHHSFASMAARLRLKAGQGHSDNQLIWVAEPDYDPTPQAFALLDSWLTTGAKPSHAQDACWNNQGELIAQGDNVWAGAWSGAARDGDCLARFPIHQSPRNAAGMPRRGDYFQCALISVTEAMAADLYGNLDMKPYQAMLELVCPQGVCDYRQPDQARPTGL